MELTLSMLMMSSSVSMLSCCVWSMFARLLYIRCVSTKEKLVKSVYKNMHEKNEDEKGPLGCPKYQFIDFEALMEMTHKY